ncbi:MAG: hypothetical protein ACYDH2_12290 [Anaerolineaceae bacterium]
MKNLIKVVTALVFTVLALFVLSGCAKSGGVVDTTVPTAETPGDQVAEASTAAQGEGTNITTGEFVFTGEGDPDLAAKTNALMLAIKNRDANALTVMLKYHTRPEEYYQGMVNAFTDPSDYAYEFESWTVDEALWYEERGFGIAWGDVTLKNGDIVDYYVIFQYVIEDGVKKRVITQSRL